MESDCSLIANPNGNAWEFATKVYKELAQKTSRFELNTIQVTTFRDKECKPHIEKNVRRKFCFFIHDSSLPPAEWFLQLCLVNQALRNSSAQEVIDVLPYLKFSRQDRKDESRVPISARAIADVIVLHADRAMTLELHNPSIQGFYSIPFDNLYSFPLVTSYLKENYPTILDNLVIMSPDAGGATRAKGLAQRLGIQDIAIGYKTRDRPGEVSGIRILGSVQGRDVLIVDDIVDSGNTLIAAAQALRAEGAKHVYAYCTHGLFSQGTEKLLKTFDKFFVGDTIAVNNPPQNLEIISFARLFAEAIYRVSEGKSLSALFS